MSFFKKKQNPYEQAAEAQIAKKAQAAYYKEKEKVAIGAAQKRARSEGGRLNTGSSWKGFSQWGGKMLDNFNDNSQRMDRKAKSQTYNPPEVNPFGFEAMKKGKKRKMPFDW